MSEKNPFSAIAAATTIRRRPGTTDAAVERIAPPADGPVARSNDAARVRVRPSSYAPRSGGTRAYGAPISEPLVTTAQERARKGQTNPGQ